MENKHRRIGPRDAVGDQHAELGALGPVRGAGAQPICGAKLVGERDRTAGEQGRRNRFRRLDIGDAPARRRLVERETEPQIARRRDRRDAAKRRGEMAGERVGAAMPAEQRDRDRSVLGHRDHRRLVALVGDQRGKKADQDAAGADADNRPALDERQRKAIVEAVVGLVAFAR